MSHATYSPTLNPDPSLLIGQENSNHLIALTIQQIAKDFGMYGYKIHYAGVPEEAYDPLLKQIRSIIESAIKEGYGKLKELLYRIDVSEKSVNDLIISHPDVSAPKLISKLIIEREFRKVCFRINYGSK
jgi:hypothetical protein